MNDELFPDGMLAEEWYSYCRTRQKELFRGDGELLCYNTVEPATASIAELLMVKGLRVAC